MLTVSTILLYIATALICISTFLTKKKQVLFSFKDALIYLFLFILAFNNARYVNNFSTFSILLILSPLPLIATAFNFKVKKTNQSNDESNEFVQSNELVKFENPQNQNVEGFFLEGFALFLTSLIISITSLFLAKESVFSYIISLPVAVLFICIYLLKKPKLSHLDTVGKFLMFLSAGLNLGQIIAVFLYNFSILNIIFAFSCLLFAIYCILHAYIKNRYLKVLLYFSLFLLISTILFL